MKWIGNCARQSIKARIRVALTFAVFPGGDQSHDACKRLRRDRGAGDNPEVAVLDHEIAVVICGRKRDIRYGAHATGRSGSAHVLLPRGLRVHRARAAARSPEPGAAVERALVPDCFGNVAERGTIRRRIRRGPILRRMRAFVEFRSAHACGIGRTAQPVDRCGRSCGGIALLASGRTRVARRHKDAHSLARGLLPQTVVEGQLRRAHLLLATSVAHAHHRRRGVIDDVCGGEIDAVCRSRGSRNHQVHLGCRRHRTAPFHIESRFDLIAVDRPGIGAVDNHRGRVGSEAGDGTEVPDIADVDVAASGNGDCDARARGACAIERVEVVNGGEIRGKDIMRTAGGGFRLRHLCRNLRGAAKVAERDYAADDAGERRGNLRIAGVGDVLHAFNPIAVQLGVKGA